MTTLAEYYQYWLEKESKAKDEHSKQIAKNKIQEIISEAKKSNVDLFGVANAENHSIDDKAKSNENDVKKMETLVKNDVEIDFKIMENLKQEIDKIKRVFKYKMMDAESSIYLKEIEEKVESFQRKQKTIVGPNNVKYQTGNGEIYYFNRLKQTAYFENGIEYEKEELTKIFENGTTQKGLDAIHFLKQNFNAKYVNI
ncbi:MAG: hypothetical protein NTW25_00460 [Candidatus Kapabacteria bacterium]|nr:hypothetical protein [Candidatus Kapabacteria bacterium]